MEDKNILRAPSRYFVDTSTSEVKFGNTVTEIIDGNFQYQCDLQYLSAMYFPNSIKKITLSDGGVTAGIIGVYANSHGSFKVVCGDEATKTLVKNAFGFNDNIITIDQSINA